MHKSMQMQKRCENCLTGFLLLDLWEMVSHRLEKQRGLPRGTLFIAGQTKTALQNVAWCSDLVEESLKDHYEQRCQGTEFMGAPPPLHFFEDDDGDPDVDEQGKSEKEAATEMMNLFVNEAQLDQELENEEENNPTKEPEPDHDGHYGFKGLPDADDLEAMLDAEVEKEAPAAAQTSAQTPDIVEPETLLEALQGLSQHSCKVSLFDRIFRLTMYVRFCSLDKCLVIFEYFCLCFCFLLDFVFG